MAPGISLQDIPSWSWLLPAPAEPPEWQRAPGGDRHLSHGPKKVTRAQQRCRSGTQGTTGALGTGTAPIFYNKQKLPVSEYMVTLRGQQEATTPSLKNPSSKLSSLYLCRALHTERSSSSDPKIPFKRCVCTPGWPFLPRGAGCLLRCHTKEIKMSLRSLLFSRATTKTGLG